MSALHGNFNSAIQAAERALATMGQKRRPQMWQGVKISHLQGSVMYELINWDFRVPIATEDLDALRQSVNPNLPWADDHFYERVCGYPMNPGEQWKRWPWANSAERFLDDEGKFEVNYMERFWAGKPFDDGSTLAGIRGRPYGDLDNLVELLANDPYTRQAYLPIYFPEDTGAGGRVPCSLGYHWMMRDNHLHVFYPIRSCDLWRHFRDDIYLAVRLTLWMLKKLRARDDAWNHVSPGMFSMWIGSLHVFENDYHALCRKLGHEPNHSS